MASTTCPRNKKSLFLWPTLQFHHLLIDQRILKNVTKHPKKPVKTSNESSFHFVDLKLRQETPHLMCAWATSNYLWNTKMNKTFCIPLLAPSWRGLGIGWSLVSWVNIPCVSGRWWGGIMTVGLRALLGSWHVVSSFTECSQWLQKLWVQSREDYNFFCFLSWHFVEGSVRKDCESERAETRWSTISCLASQRWQQYITLTSLT